MDMLYDQLDKCSHLQNDSSPPTLVPSDQVGGGPFI